ncbi:hypothetical protein Bca101_067727 [Brassica carinata]
MTEIDGQMKLFAEKLHENLQKHASTDEQHVASIDIQTSEICTKADLDKLADEVYTEITSLEDSQDRCLNQTYFPLNNIVGGLESSIEGMQKGIRAIQTACEQTCTLSIDRQKTQRIARRTSTAINRQFNKGIDRYQLYPRQNDPTP